MVRTDVHRPSAIVPSDYELVDHFGWMTVPAEYNEDGDSMIREPYGEHAMATYDDGPRVDLWPDLQKCDVCGARFVHGAVMTHVPTGLLLSIGHDCAAKYLSLRALPKRERADRAARRMRRRLAWKKMRLMLAAFPLLNKALKADHHISRDLRAKAIKWGDLSEKQIALAFKLEVQAAENAERKANEPDAVPVPETNKRFTLKGLVLGTRSEEGYYGATVLKMLVQVEAEGGVYKVWGTCPEAIWGNSEGSVVKGCQVEFACKVQRSNDDESFGFFSRPTKARILVHSEAA
jgi:hypothetical protein